MKTFFISSTFKDMQAERDVLHERVFPRLRGLIKSFGEDVQEVDLRWGVDTVNMSEEESGHEVLRICIDAIDRCKPYLIVLLGERYGWIPGREIVESARDQRISNRYEEEMSITELEIRYGALLNDDAFDKCIFCFRSPEVIEKIDASQQGQYRAESPRHAERLAALKRQICGKKDAIILHYSAGWDPEKGALCGLEDFEAQVYDCLSRMIREDLALQQAKSLLERQVGEVELIREGYVSTYIRRYPEEYWITKYLSSFLTEISFRNGSRKTDCLLLTGEAGCGKSALMAYMASSVPKVKDNAILCFAAASGCKDVASLKRYIAYRLESILSQPHEEDPASIDRRLRELDKLAEKKGIVCFVDALDQIYQGVTDPYLDLPALCPNLFWVFSALPEFPFDTAAADYSCKTVVVEGLLPVQRREMIHATASKRGKKLDDELAELICREPGAGNPLFLSLVMQRLFMMNQREFEAAEAIAPGMEGLHRYMQSLLEEMPQIPDRMATYILNVTAKRFDQEQFSHVLMLVACSQDGLTEQELEVLLAMEGVRFSPVKFQQIVSYLYDAFDCRSNGKWDFHHRLFREAVLEQMDDADRERIFGLLVNYALKDADFLRREGFRYLLAGRHPEFVRVLENAIDWENRTRVFDFIGTSARDDAGVRAFLEEIVQENLTDPMAKFWLRFEEFLYGSDVDALSGRIIGALLEGSISDPVKWQLALRHTYDAEKDQLLSLIELAQGCAASLPEPERTIAQASIQAEHSRVLSVLHLPYDRVQPAAEQSMEAIDRAMTLLEGTGTWQQYLSLFQSGRTAANIAISWQDPRADQYWCRLLGHLESLSRFAQTQEDDYGYYQVLFLLELCDAYSSRDWRDYTKAKQFGDRALELSEIAASRRPTIRNLKNKFNTNVAYTKRLKDEYTVPYRQQNVDCARRLLAMQNTKENKRQLAAAEAEYGLAYLKAEKVNAEPFRVDKNLEALHCLNHSAQLFEELIASGYPESRTLSHAAFLAERVIALSGSYPKLIQLGKRSLELLEQRQQLLQNQDDPYYSRQLDWCVGWTGRVRAAMATVYMLVLDYENALECAREGIALNRLNAKRSKAYLTELLTCVLYQAQSAYCLRRDEQALAACREADDLLDELGSQGESREGFDAELYYIRSRIALARGEKEAAWELCQACMARKKSDQLSNKVLILKADCLEALEDPEADSAWGEAFTFWRKAMESFASNFSKEATSAKVLAKHAPVVKENNLNANAFALTAYYFGYCYHHYVTDEKRFRMSYDTLDRQVLYALYHLGRGDIKGRMPYGMKEQILDVAGSETLPECQDLRSFVEALEAMMDMEKKTVDSAIYPLILEQAERFQEERFTGRQIGTLQNAVTTLCEHLREERRKLYPVCQEWAVLCHVFHLEGKLPTFHVGLDFQGDRICLWPEEAVRDISQRWYALLKLTLLLLRKAPGTIQQVSGCLRSAYNVLTEDSDGTGRMEDADLGFLSRWELEGLLEIYNLGAELRSRYGNKYWYAMKNIWTAELCRRTGSGEYITRRLGELEAFLSAKPGLEYQKIDMGKEVAQGAMHLVKALNARCQGKMTMDVVRWSESVDALRGRLDAATLYAVTPVTSEDRQWLEEVKLTHSRIWLEADMEKLSRSIRR